MQQPLISEDRVVHLCAGRPRYFPHTIVCRATGREVEQVATDVPDAAASLRFPGARPIMTCTVSRTVGMQHSTRVIRAEYRGIQYRVASRHPYSGIGWTLLWGDGSTEPSSGAFYDDCPDHPEGAFAWAESAVKRRIDRLHETLDTYVPAELRLPALESL